MEKSKMLGMKIAELRKQKGMTQEALAKELCVSNQAVSKWEANQSSPDIQLLPQISDLFGITLDELFGREIIKTEEEKNISKFPWEDDGVLRAVLYIGHTLVKAQEGKNINQNENKRNEIEFRYYGEALNIISELSVNCDDVKGSVTASGSVNCGNVEGSVKASGSVTCDNVKGDVNASGSVNCDDIGGKAAAYGNITCNDIQGSAEANGNLTCDTICGNAKAGANIICDEIRGIIEAGETSADRLLS